MDEDRTQRQTMTEEEYEQLCQENEARNKPFLELFRGDLEAAGLSAKTVKRYVDNADFFLNTYLVHENIIPMEQGCEKALTFLSTWMEYKCLASEAEIRKMGTSIKRFYKIMMEHGLISEDEFDFLKADIKAALAYL